MPSGVETSENSRRCGCYRGEGSLRIHVGVDAVWGEFFSDRCLCCGVETFLIGVYDVWVEVSLRIHVGVYVGWVEVFLRIHVGVYADWVEVFLRIHVGVYAVWLKFL